MATYQEAIAALRRAHDAGDVEAARRLAALARRLREQGAEATQPGTGDPFALDTSGLNRVVADFGLPQPEQPPIQPGPPIFPPSAPVPQTQIRAPGFAGMRPEAMAAPEAEPTPAQGGLFDIVPPGVTEPSQPTRTGFAAMRPAGRPETPPDPYAYHPFFSEQTFAERNITEPLRMGWTNLQTATNSLGLQDAVERIAENTRYLEEGHPVIEPEAFERMNAEERANLENSLMRVSELRLRAKEFLRDPRLQAALESGDFGVFMQAVQEDPTGIVARTFLESAPLMLPAATATALTGPIGGLGAAGVSFGVGSYAVEQGLMFLDVLEQSGVDTTNPDAMRAALQDPQLVAQARETANLKGLGVGLFDALSAGLAGRILAPARVLGTQLTRAGREAVNIPAQLATQGALGGAGEAAGSYMATGAVNPAEVGLEAIAEFGTAPIEVAGIRSVIAQPREGPSRPDQIGAVPQGGPAAPPPAVPPAGPAPAGPAPAAGPQPDLFAELSELVAQPNRPVEEIVAAADRARDPVAIGNAALAEAGLPSIGQAVTVRLPEGDVVNGTLIEAQPVTGEAGGATIDLRIRATDGTVYDLYADEAEILPAGDGSPAAPVEATRPEDVAQAAARAQEPTPAQAEAGNYRMGHVSIQGLDIAIETPQGGTRTATDGSWSVEDFPAHYGYVKAGEGADGDKVDVYVGPDPAIRQVYVIDQIDPATGQFDEHKIMLGFPSSNAALDTYDAAFSDGSGMSRVGSIKAMTIQQLKAWLANGDTTAPVSYEPPAAAPEGPQAPAPETAAFREPAGSAEAPPVPASRRPAGVEPGDRLTRLGTNRAGDVLYEDARGVRHVSRNGVLSSEPVQIIPQRGGGTGVSVDRSRRSWEFQTQAEAQASIDEGERERQRRVAEQAEADRAALLEQPEVSPEEEARAQELERQDAETDARIQAEEDAMMAAIGENPVKLLRQTDKGFRRTISRLEAHSESPFAAELARGYLAGLKVSRTRDINMTLALGGSEGAVNPYLVGYVAGRSKGRLVLEIRGRDAVKVVQALEEDREPAEFAEALGLREWETIDERRQRQAQRQKEPSAAKPEAPAPAAPVEGITAEERTELEDIVARLMLSDHAPAVTFAEGLSAALRNANRTPIKRSSMEFYRRRSRELLEQAGAVGTAAMEEPRGLEELFEPELLKQYRAIRENERTPANIQDVLERADTRMKELNRQINEAGYLLRDVDARAPKNVRTMREQWSSIGGAAARLVREEYRVLQGSKMADAGKVDRAIRQLASVLRGEEQAEAPAEKPTGTALAEPLTLEVEGRRFIVDGYEDASRKFEAVRDEMVNNQGMEPDDVARPILRRGKEIVGYLSYNGRVWEGVEPTPEQWKQGVRSRLLYDPTPRGQGEGAPVARERQLSPAVAALPEEPAEPDAIDTKGYDFVRTFPVPDTDALEREGRETVLDAATDVQEALASFHGELETELFSYINTIEVLQDAQRKGFPMDPQTGRRTTPTTRKRWEKDAPGLIARASEDYANALDAYESAGFDRDARDKFDRHVRAKWAALAEREPELDLTAGGLPEEGVEPNIPERTGGPDEVQGAGEEAPAGTPAGRVRPAEGGRPARGTPAERGERGPEEAGAGDEGPAEPEAAPAGPGVRRGGPVSRPDTARGGRDRGEGDTAAAGRDDGEGPDAGGLPVESDRRRKLLSGTQDFQIGEDFSLAPSSSILTRIRNNIVAIRTVKALIAAKRKATPAEQAQLAQYVGWGGLKPVFDEDNAKYAGERAELKELLTTEEFASARASVLNAHYTSREVIEGMYRALERMGFDGGRILEPAAGVGHFMGLLPDKFRANSRWTAVELDTITGQIARHLYPRQDVRVQGFEAAQMGDNTFDVAIGNVPFGEFGVHDPRYNKHKFRIHDYFFAKALDKVRPGGIVMFITSRFTMDKVDSSVRDYLGARADLVAAIRLPGGSKGAFAGNAGTEVTTDIIILRKRAEGETVGGPVWNGLRHIKTPDGRQIQVNQYFAKNPEMMLGTMNLTGTMYGAEQGQLEPPAEGRWQDLFDKAIARLWDKAYEPSSEIEPEEEPATEEDGEAVDLPSWASEGSLVLDKDGRIRQVVFGKPKHIEAKKLQGQTGKKLRGLLDLRDAARVVIQADLEENAAEQKAGRKRLNELYGKFVKQFGAINKANITRSVGKDGRTRIMRRSVNMTGLVLEDPDAPLLMALEDFDDQTGNATKAAIFEKPVISRPVPVDRVDHPREAIPVVLRTKGKLDIDEVARLAGVSVDQAIEQLAGMIYKNPAHGGWETADQYLSGNVRQKLELARESLEADPALQANVEALTAIIPKDIEPSPAVNPDGTSASDIYAAMGATWIDPEIVQRFAGEFWKEDWRDIVVKYVPEIATWTIRTSRYLSMSTKMQTTYGTPRVGGVDIFEAALNGRKITVYNALADGSREVDAKATAEAGAKVAEVKKAFSVWVWQDTDRSAALARKYNDLFNSIVPRRYSGEHLEFPGIASHVKTSRGVVPFALRDHQKAAVWRILSSGKSTLLNHVVGAGKTFAMIAAGMEGRRLGLVRRPMYVVPNHMLDQFSREFIQAYPAARLLVATKANFATDKRRQFVAKIATGDYDAVIITHSAFGKIAMSRDAYLEYYGDMLAELAHALAMAKAEKGDNRKTVRQIEAAKKNLEQKLQKLTSTESKDRGITFEETGVDQIYVDEAHLFKNLPIVSKMPRVKGMPTAQSQRAVDLFIKTRYLHKINPGRGVVFSTATPVANTLGELFVMQSYLQPDVLEQLEIDNFDTWAKSFATTVSSIETTPSGKGMRSVERFARFVNVPELAVMFSEVNDLQTAEMLNLPRPAIMGGAPTIIAAEPSEEQLAKVEELAHRAATLTRDMSVDNMLKIVSEGRKSATDIRLLDDGYPDHPDSKINLAVDKIYEIWQDGEEPGLAQLAFLDLGTPGSVRRRAPIAAPEPEAAGEEIIKVADVEDETAEDAEAVEEAHEDADAFSDYSGFDLYNDIKRKLIARGVPADQVAFIHDAKTDVQKGDLFRRTRDGKVRVLIGSTEKMGIGTNVQDRLIALHHLDAPWRPADMRQRDGRGIRQGNMNPEIGIYRYVTKQTFDVYMWQTLEVKDRMITQFFAGAQGKRKIEDIDLSLPEASTIKAIATGDNRFVELAEKGKELEDLSIQRNAFARQVGEARRQTRILPERIAKIDEDLTALRTDQQGVPAKEELAPDKLTMKVGSRTITGRKEIGEAIVRLATGQVVSLPADSSRDIKIGEIGPFAVALDVRQSAMDKNSVYFQVTIKGQKLYEGQATGTSRTEPVLTGIVDRIVNGLNAIREGGRITQREHERAQLVRDLEAVKNQPTEFPHEGRFRELDARVKEIEAALMAEANPPQPGSQQPAPTDATTPETEAEDDGPDDDTEIGGNFRQTDTIDRTGTFRLVTRADREGARRKAIKDLRTKLDGLGLSDVRLNVVDEILLNGRSDIAGGWYWNNVITVALTSPEPASVLTHEAIHAMRELRLFTEREWNVLSEAAEKLWIEQFGIYRAYANEPHAIQIEEAIAEAAAAHAAGRLKYTGGILNRTLNRISRILEAIRNAIHGNGFRTAESILEKATTGGIGNRGREPSTPISADEWARTVREMAGPDAVPDEVLAQIRRDMGPVFSMLGDVSNRVRSRIAPSPSDPNMLVIDREVSRDLNVAKQWFFTPQKAVRKWPMLADLVEFGVRTEMNLSRWSKRFMADYDFITAPLRAHGMTGRIADRLKPDEGRKRHKFQQLQEILWIGDAEEAEFTEAELRDMGVNDADVIKAYFAIRKLIERIGRFVDQHRRAMLPKLRERKFALLKRAASLRAMDDAEFRSLYGQRSRLRSKLRRGGQGMSPTLIIQRLEHIEQRLNLIREEQDEYQRIMKEIDAIDAQLAKTSIRRRKGYIPHKFFGSWGLYEILPPKEEGGEPVYRLIGGKHGFYETQGAAARSGLAWLKEHNTDKNNPKAVVVRPIEFSFPASTATGLSDASYWRFMKRVGDVLEIKGQELHDVVKGVARRRHRRRIAGFAQYRTGVEGYEEDMDRVMRSHIGEAVRYVTLDKLKYQAINAMERMGLSRYRSFNRDQQVLQTMMEAWFLDVNGEKQPTERALDELWEKKWAKPAVVGSAAALATGTATMLGISSNPFVGAALASYVGYRFYRAMKNGGNFKSRALVTAMAGDVAHLKLGMIFNVFSALRNLTQTAVNTYPVLGEKYTALGIKIASEAWYSRHIAGRPNRYAKLLERADVVSMFRYTDTGTFQFSRESRAARISLFLFNNAEYVNRSVSFLGAYKRAIDRGATEAAAFREATQAMIRTQHHYGAANKPQLLRTLLLRLPGQFKNFVFQQVAFVSGLRGAEIPRFLLSITLIAGFMGWPFMDLLDWLLKSTTGFSPLLWAKEKAILALAEGELVGSGANFLARGLPSVFGEDLTVGAGMGDKFLPTQLQDWMGPSIGTVDRLAALGELNAGLVDYIQTISPGLGKPLKSLEAAANGLPIWDAISRPEEFWTAVMDERIEFTNPWKKGAIELNEDMLGPLDLARMAVGSTPLPVSRVRDIQAIALHEADRLKAQTAPYISRIIMAARRFENEPARRDAEIARIIQEAKDTDDLEITPDQANRYITNAFEPRLERIVGQTRLQIRERIDRLSELAKEAERE